MPPTRIFRQYTFDIASFTVPSFEDPAMLVNLRDAAIAEYQPVNSQELFAVERIAIAQLAMLRVQRLEAGMFTGPLADSVEAFDKPIPTCKRRRPAPLFLRYREQTAHLYRHAMEDFHLVVSQR